LTRRLRSSAALLVLLVLMLGVPAALAGTVGNPARALPELIAGDVTDAVLIGLLAAVAWLAWAQFTLATMVETVSAVRRTPVPRRIPGVLVGQQQLVRALVTAAFLLGPLSTGLSSPPPAYAAALPAPSSVGLAAAALPGPSPVDEAGGEVTRPAAPTPAGAPAVPTTSYLVRAGDGPTTYWDLAQTHLGSGERWGEIWQLNEGREQPGGAVMTSPHRLLPGWTVLLPAEAAGDATTPLATATDPARDSEVTVRPGDTLWNIAEEMLGDGGRYDEIAAASTGVQPDGRRLVDPDLIRPGWRVTVPDLGAPVLDTPAPVRERLPAAPPGQVTAPSAEVEPAPPAAAVPPAPAAQEPAAVRPDPLAEQPALPSPAGEASEPSPTPARQDPAALSSTAVVTAAVAFTGGGLLLAGLSLTAVRRHRRRQGRERNPGRAMSTPAPELAAVEKALLSSGPQGQAQVAWLDAALRSLVPAFVADGGQLPDVVAVRMTEQVIELVLTGPRKDPPAPWQADDSGERWSVRRGDRLGFEAGDAVYHYAPYPTLATVGVGPDGAQWLLDLERVGALSLTGDPQRCLDLARFLAAELAHNCWSEQLRVTLAGFGAELAGLPERVRHCTDVDAAVEALLTSVTGNVDAGEQCGVDVLESRRRRIADDVWSAHVLLLAPGAAHRSAGLERLLETMRAQRSRTAVALVLTGDDAHESDTRWQLHVDPDGQLTIPALGLQLTAQQLPAAEAADLAALLAQAAAGTDRPAGPARGGQPWDAYADATGAPLPTLTAPRPVPSRVALHLTGRDSVHGAQPAGSGTDGDGDAGADAASSVLPLAAAAYLPRTATTTADVEALAPAISPEVRRRVEDADPDLDIDLAAWHDPADRRPKLRLLGPVALTAWGEPPPKRAGFYTEVVAYLASRPHGATVGEFAADLWPDDPGITGKTTPRQAASVARGWLGLDERTGQPYLSKAPDGATGVGVWRVEGLLVDAELFRRLRLRGVARGADGITDLQAALGLVRGVPLDQRRTDGYRWLVDIPLEHEYTAMVVDVAHLVATHHLAAGEPALAEQAAQASLRAGAHDDVALLDLVAACDAAGNGAEADRNVRRILDNHAAEVEEDLPPRTYEVLRRRQWLPQDRERAQVG